MTTTKTTAISTSIPKFESLCGKEFKPVKTPMSEGYRPLTDGLPLCIEDDSFKYRSMIGCCVLKIVLGKFYIAYRFNILHQEGHLKAVKRIFYYLKTFLKGRLFIDTAYSDYSIYPLEDHANQMEFYTNGDKNIPNELPYPKEPKVIITFYVDKDYAHDLVTRRSITGTLVMLNNTPVR
jgi:hypothetical protein